jgi:two-component system chemotaxis sensor kinase CheA
MTTNEEKKHYRLANISTILLILFLGIFSIIEALRLELRSVETLVGLFVVVALILLVPVFRATKNYYNLAFYTPAIFTVFVTMLMMALEWRPDYYLLACLCACGISCLYSNFSMTTAFVIVQNIAIGVMVLLGIPIVGDDASILPTLVGWLVYVFASVLLVVLNHTATTTLDEALDDRNSFRTFLSTTANYLAMVDKSNKILYVSKPLSQLTHIEDPELTKGRSLIDLFPGRELKLLASKMLGQRELYEEDWEFVLDGQKRFFKAASNVMSGTSKGTLINLHDMTHLAERDEIAAMKDSLKIGLFFMNREGIIQDNYSRYLEELLSEDELNGKKFIDLLTASVTSKELDAVRDYFDMVFDSVFDQATLEDINPLQELHYVSVGRGTRKIFQCEFITVERGKGEIFLLVTIYDITARVELQQRLLEEENRRQEEMRTIFELIQVDPNVFGNFQEDADYEFNRIDDTLKNDKLSDHETLVEIYQSVHAIKSNAVILGLNTFGGKAHDLESKIKRLREKEEEVTFDEMLNLTVEIERLAQTKSGFKDTIDRINAFKVGNVEGQGQKQKGSDEILIESLDKTTSKAATDLGKKVKFIATEIDHAAVDMGPRRVIKEVLMQLIRNAVVHGIEMPEERLEKGKNETGVVKLSIKTDGKTIHVRLADDGRGLDFDKISEKALSLNLIKPEEASNKSSLLNTIFLPGFSTAEEEGMHAGRGIGLNLVRDRVRDENGTIKLQTESNKGTIFNLFFPVGKDMANNKAS